jgi:hypothetical protein
MSSNINTANINGNFPVAGINNDSQTFRDNFTNIRNNLDIASDEITALQTNALLKTPLPGTTVNNDFGGASISNVNAVNFTEPSYTVLTTSGAVSVSYTNGDFQQLTPTGSVTLTFTDWPTHVSTYATMRMLINITDTAFHITLDPKVTIGLISIPGMFGSVMNPPVVGHYLFEFSTYDGGLTIIVALISDPGTPGDIGPVAANVSVIQGNVTTITNNVGILQSNVSTLQANVSVIQGNVTTITNNVGILQSNVTTLQSNISTINANVSVIQGNITSITNNVGILQSNVTTLQSITLDKLTDVTITSPANNDHIRYDTALSQWVNESDYTLITLSIADDGSGIQTVFLINGDKIRSNTGGVISYMKNPLTFEVGKTYRFDQSNASNHNHQILFSTTPDTAVPALITPYLTGITNSGIAAGQAGAYTEITVTSTTPTLYLYTNDEDPFTDTSKMGGEYPIYVGSGCCFTGSEVLASTAAANLFTSVSYFTTTVASTATLAAGANGRMKTFIANSIAPSAPMVLTVTNPGWVGSTITFTATGQSCMLQYINNKWFCIGNNGAAFA